jgi:CubicO group peptidase (beta-lactamase class C family)
MLAFGPASLPAQQPARTGFAADRLARIDRFMQQYVDSGQIAGAVGLVLRNGKVVYRHAVGWSDLESRRPMTEVALFRIASQTKAITTAVILSLLEEGKLSLWDPVSRYIPAFANTTVMTRSDTGRAIKPAGRPITISQLLTHTSGISYGTDSLVATLYAAKGLGPSAGWGWYTADKDEPICTTIERLGTLPFVAQPGERWVYGYNTDILGCVAERASGMPLDELVRTRITGPLQMRDTYFFVPQPLLSGS